jgi:hypothetical protein
VIFHFVSMVVGFKVCHHLLQRYVC